MELLFHEKDLKALKVAAKTISDFLKKDHHYYSWGGPSVTVMISKTGKFKLNFSGRKGLGSIALLRVTKNKDTKEYELVDTTKAFPMHEFTDLLLEALMENG